MESGESSRQSEVESGATLPSRETWLAGTSHRTGSTGIVPITRDRNRHVILLSGNNMADVREDTSNRGWLGFQVHAGAQFASVRVLVKLVALRRIEDP